MRYHPRPCIAFQPSGRKYKKHELADNTLEGGGNL